MPSGGLVRFEPAALIEVFYNAQANKWYVDSILDVGENLPGKFRMTRSKVTSSNPSTIGDRLKVSSIEWVIGDRLKVGRGQKYKY
jgi:hypothetical protein